MGTAFFGFAGGFYGPIFLSPGASQGPLLGILLTGPLGALLGLVASLIYIRKMRKTSVS
jgi:energy-converting hydrogenase Eha subunit B